VANKSTNALFNHHSAVKWKPNTKNVLVYKTYHQASISALSPILLEYLKIENLKKLSRD